MVEISGDRDFARVIAGEHGEASLQYSVARIYGKPDETLRKGKVHTWYYFDDRVAFVFEGNIIQRVVDLLPSS
jgi:hypothetical protein